jgi:hypothetical protein
MHIHFSLHNRELVARAEGVGSPNWVVLDMDTSVSPAYGEQSAYNISNDVGIVQRLVILFYVSNTLRGLRQGARSLRDGNLTAIDDWCPT